MAIYRHVDSISEIIDAVLDRFVQTADVLGHGVDPDCDPHGWLVATFERMYVALLEVPGVLPVLGELDSIGDGMLDVLEATLAVFESAGIEREPAVDALYTLMAFTLGAAGIATTSRRLQPGNAAAPETERIRRAGVRFSAESALARPHLVASAPALAAALMAPDFQSQLRRLVATLPLTDA